MPSLRKLAQFPPVAALLTDSPFRELAGTVGLKADVRRDDASSPFAGTLSLKLADMRWGLAPLQDTVGETASLGASFSAQPESGSASVSDLTLKAGQLSGKGNASTDGKKLDAALSLALSSLKGIAPSLSGPLELKLRASGPLLSPGGELTLASPHLGVETATLEGLPQHAVRRRCGRQGYARCFRHAEGCVHQGAAGWRAVALFHGMAVRG